MRTPLRARQAGRVRLGTLLLLLGGAAAVLGLCDLGFLLRGRVDEAAARAEAKLGRPVRVQAVHLHLLPEVALDLEGARIETEGAPPLLSIAALRLRLPLWPLVRSLGRAPRVRLIELDGVEADLARLPDGRPQLADVLERLGEVAPVDPARRAQLLEAGIERAVLRAALRCPGGDGASLGQVTLTAEEVRGGAAPRVRLEAGQRSEAPALRLGLDLGPLPTEPGIEPLALLRGAELHAGRVPMAALRCVLGERTPAIGSLEQADVTLELPAAAGRIHLRGAARVSALPRGDLGLRADIDVDPLAGDLRAKELELTLGAMSLRGAADLRRLWLSPEVHHLELRSQELRLEDLLAVMGPGGGGAAARSRHPASLHLSASGPPGEARISAELEVPEVAPALAALPLLGRGGGLPLSLQLKGRLAPLGADLDQLSLRLGPATLSARLRLRARRLRLTIEEATLDRALLAEALPLLGPELRALPSEAPLGVSGIVDCELGGGLAGVLNLGRPGAEPLLALRLGGTTSAPALTHVDRLGGPGLLERARGLLPPGDGPRPGEALRERIRERLRRR